MVAPTRCRSCAPGARGNYRLILRISRSSPLQIEQRERVPFPSNKSPRPLRVRLAGRGLFPRRRVKRAGLGLFRGASGDGVRFLFVARSRGPFLRRQSSGAAHCRRVCSTALPSASQRVDQLVQFLSHRFHVWIGKGGIQRAHGVGLVARLVQRVEQVVVRHLAGRALGTLRALRAIVALRTLRATGIA